MDNIQFNFKIKNVFSVIENFSILLTALKNENSKNHPFDKPYTFNYLLEQLKTIKGYLKKHLKFQETNNDLLEYPIEHICEYIFESLNEPIEELVINAKKKNLDICCNENNDEDTIKILDIEKLSSELELLIQTSKYKNFSSFFDRLNILINKVCQTSNEIFFLHEIKMLNDETNYLKQSNKQISAKLNSFPTFEIINELNKKLITIEEKINKTYQDFETYASQKALAQSFNERTKEYQKFATFYYRCMLVALFLNIFIFFVSIYDLLHNQNLLTQTNFLFLTPVVISFLWLAWFFSKKHFYYSHLENDYKYKIDLSTTYYGYKQECERLKNNEEMSQYLYERVLYNITKNPLETLPKGANMPYSELIQFCLKSQDKAK